MSATPKPYKEGDRLSITKNGSNWGANYRISKIKGGKVVVEYTAGGTETRTHTIKEFERLVETGVYKTHLSEFPLRNPSAIKIGKG